MAFFLADETPRRRSRNEPVWPSTAETPVAHCLEKAAGLEQGNAIRNGPDPRIDSPVIHRRHLLQLAVSAAIFLPGCRLLGNRAERTALPGKYSMRVDQLQVVSDFELLETHPVIADLLKLKRDVGTTLDLRTGTRPVAVYLFSDEKHYSSYWSENYPSYPSRRAYFIQSPDGELAVYTAWSDRIQEDLRHEYTHGILHSSLQTVPLWLDEGIAEYFEVAGTRLGGLNSDYAPKLAQAIQVGGWRPDLQRLERLERVEDMQRSDYREAWAWVHFLLHDSPESRDVLVRYVSSLRDTDHPTALHTFLMQEVPQADVRLTQYLTTLPSTGGRLSSRR